MPTLERPVSSREARCRNNAWIARAGWRLRTQNAARVRNSRDVSMDGPVVVAISVPAGPGDNLDEYAKPILDLLCRHGVVMADTARPVHGISLIWHDAPEIEVSVEPAALREVSNE